jgi:hypothetical protein
MQNFKPTKEMIDAAETLFVTMAHCQIIEPIVRGYETKILEDMQPHMAKKWIDHGCKDEIITNPEHSYLLEDDAFAEYDRRCKVERDKAGLYVANDDHCPLLVAKNMKTDAENILLEAMQPLTKISATDACMDIKTRDRLVDICLKMLAPFVSDSDTVLKRFAA